MLLAPDNRYRIGFVMSRTPKLTALSVNPHVAALPPYNAGMSLARARKLSGHDDVARLASNENPDGCSPKVLAALAGGGFEPWRYADPACTALREALAARRGVDPQVNGAAQIAALAALADQAWMLASVARVCRRRRKRCRALQ